MTIPAHLATTLVSIAGYASIVVFAFGCLLFVGYLTWAVRVSSRIRKEERGPHASQRAVAALKYAPSPKVCQVEVAGPSKLRVLSDDRG